MTADKASRGPRAGSEKHQGPETAAGVPKPHFLFVRRIKTRINDPRLRSPPCCQNVLSAGRHFLCHQLLINRDPTGRIAAVKKRKTASNGAFPHTFRILIPVRSVLLCCGGIRAEKTST